MQSIRTIYGSIQHQKEQVIFQPVLSVAYEKLQFPCRIDSCSAENHSTSGMDQTSGK